MLSKAQNKYIRSLSQQKFRKEFNAFIAEGDKIAAEWLKSDAKIKMIVAIDAWAEAHKSLIDRHAEASLHVINESELQQISCLQTANKVLLVVEMPEEKLIKEINGWCIALDNIQDPGNLGTIIRIADWFGIKQVLCSPDCVDFYNPKVVQSGMGGHLRVELNKVELEPVLLACKLPVLAATLNGQPINALPKIDAGVLLIGNESAGISSELINIAKYKVTIPGKGGAESLNAAVSAGILCAMLMLS